MRQVPAVQNDCEAVIGEPLYAVVIHSTQDGLIVESLLPDATGALEDAKAVTAGSSDDAVVYFCVPIGKVGHGHIQMATEFEWLGRAAAAIGEKSNG